MPTTQTQQVKLALTRTNGVTKLEFTIPEVVRNLWASKNLEVKQSTAWAGLSYYFLPKEARTKSYTALLNDYGVRDDFGSAIIDDEGRFNVGFLRCTTENGVIECPSDLSFAVLSDKVRYLARFVRAFVEQNVSDFKITGSVSIEL